MMRLSQLKVLAIVLSCFVTVCLSDEIRLTKVRSLGDLIASRDPSSDNSSQDECAICLSTLDKDANISKQECNHSFHEHCIERWLSEHETCPVCRAMLRSTTAVTTDYDQATNTTGPGTMGRNGGIYPERRSWYPRGPGVTVVPRGSY